MIWLQCRQPLERQVIGVIIGKPTFQKWWDQNTFSFLFFSFLKFSLINSHHIDLFVVNGQDRFLSAGVHPKKLITISPWRTNRNLLSDLQSQSTLTDRRAIRRPYCVTDRQTPLRLQAAILWDRLVFHCLCFLSRDILCILRCSLLSCSTLLRHIHYFRLPPLLFSCPSFDSRSISLHVFDSRSKFSFVLPPLTIVLNPRLHLFRPWAKQKKINQARRPGRCQHLNFLYSGLFSFVLLNIIAWYWHYCRPFLLSSIHDFFISTLITTKENQSSAWLPVTASYCLANIFYCFQARFSEFA